MSVLLPPFAPDSACSACSNEDTLVVFHDRATLGSWPCWPKSDPKYRIHQPHLCKRCTRCGYAWAEAPADPSAYAGEDPEEDAMPIRKTASGQVTGTETDGMAGVVKTAQQNPTIDPAWKADDEEALAQENASADQG